MPLSLTKFISLCINSLDQDKARWNFEPNQDPNCLTVWWYSWKIFFEKVYFEKKKKQTTWKHTKFPSMQRVNLIKLIVILLNMAVY